MSESRDSAWSRPEKTSEVGGPRGGRPDDRRDKGAPRGQGRAPGAHADLGQLSERRSAAGATIRAQSSSEKKVLPAALTRSRRKRNPILKGGKARSGGN